MRGTRTTIAGIVCYHVNSLGFLPLPGRPDSECRQKKAPPARGFLGLVGQHFRRAPLAVRFAPPKGTEKRAIWYTLQ